MSVFMIRFTYIITVRVELKAYLFLQIIRGISAQTYLVLKWRQVSKREIDSCTTQRLFVELSTKI